MSRAEPQAMIPGGLTERVAQAGGRGLFEQLQLLLSGHPVDQAAFALCHSMTGLALHLFDSADEANAFVDTLAADIKNELALNWPERARLVAEGQEALAALKRGPQ